MSSHDSLIRVSTGEGLRTEVTVRGHQLTSDEPLSGGGTDAGPTPYDLLAAALGSCIGMTLRLYADRKGWPLQRVDVTLRHSRLHREDCAQCPEEDIGMDRLERRIDLTGPLSDEQRARLLEIAERCPVRRTLGRGVRVESLQP